MVRKYRNFEVFFSEIMIFLNKRKIKYLVLKISHYFVDLNDMTLKMYTVLGFEIVFHNTIEGNWENFVSI